MKAIIELDVPEWQIGQQVEVFFPDTMMKKGVCELLKEKEPVRCKDCAYALYNESIQQGHIVCTKPFTERWQVAKQNDWYCADWKCKEKTNCSEYPNGSQEDR